VISFHHDRRNGFDQRCSALECFRRERRLHRLGLEVARFVPDAGAIVDLSLRPCPKPCPTSNCRGRWGDLSGSHPNGQCTNAVLSEKPGFPGQAMPGTIGSSSVTSSHSRTK
jgi:hypothetical protein